VQDAELSCTPKGTAVCKFSVACNRQWKQDDEVQKEVSFFDVSTWALARRGLRRVPEAGRGVRVVGRLKQDRWTDSEKEAASF
jgi:single-strand DNA-binding protein